MKITTCLICLVTIVFVITAASCGGKKQEEASVTYCCGNHSPNHCGPAGELADLEKTNGCKDFFSDGIDTMNVDSVQIQPDSAQEQ